MLIALIIHAKKDTTLFIFAHAASRVCRITSTAKSFRFMVFTFIIGILHISTKVVTTIIILSNITDNEACMQGLTILIFNIQV